MIAEHDLAAYRLMAEILVSLRERLNKEMLALFGQLWLAEQAPEPVRHRLAERKDREDSVAFSMGVSRDLVDYADFADIGEVLQGAGAGILEGLLPQRQVLQSRLFELHVVQMKLTLALPLNDQEIALLGTLYGRLGMGQASAPASQPAAATHTAAGPSSPSPERAPSAAPHATAPAVPPHAAVPAEIHAKAAPPEPPAPSPRAAARADAPSYEEVIQALGRGATVVVIRGLYAEIMAAAETVWSSGAIPSLRVWHAVCESQWYQEKFVQLGLKPVSDFYSILDDLTKSLGPSPPKDKLAEHLNRRGFAQCLIALREVFSKHLK